MSLVKCPECNNMISDRAVVCPHCGIPCGTRPYKAPKPRKKRYKFPNGFGSVYCLAGNRRNPWIAIKTHGWQNDEQTKRNKQLKDVVGYFPTEEEAIAALVAFNKNPYDLDVDNILFSEVFERWTADYYPTLKNRSSERSYDAAYKYCSSMYKMRMRDIRPSHIEGAMKDCTAGDSTKARIKSMFNMIYKYCLKHEIVDKDYAQLCTSISVESQIDRVPYAPEDIVKLWENIDNFDSIDICLFTIYTGVRPIEALTAAVSTFNITDWYFVGGVKTEAGIDRVIPLHPDIRPMIEKLYNDAVATGREYLFMMRPYNRGAYKPITYDAYRGRLKRSLKRINMAHHAGDGRHTFITYAKEQHMDEYLLKLVVGHEIEDVTEKVYTHRKISELVEAVSALDFKPQTPC